MKKVAMCFVCILYLLSLSGCRSAYVDDPKENTAYNDAITSLFNAMDAKNSEAIYNLFSPSIREQDKDLEDQIDKLLSVYSGPIDEIGWDGLLAGGASYSDGDYSKNASTTFPVRSGNTYYWCYLELMYENTYDDQQIGIVQMDFFTADEYCILEYDDQLKIVDSVGLTVHADATVESEIRCINSHPYMYSATTEPLDIEAVRSFFKVSDSFSEFIKQYGQPNAENIYCCYELLTDGGEYSYLQICTNNDTIYGANVVNAFEYIETIYSASGTD